MGLVEALHTFGWVPCVNLQWNGDIKQSLTCTGIMLCNCSDRLAQETMAESTVFPALTHFHLRSRNLSQSGDFDFEPIKAAQNTHYQDCVLTGASTATSGSLGSQSGPGQVGPDLPIAVGGK